MIAPKIENDESIMRSTAAEIYSETGDWYAAWNYLFWLMCQGFLTDCEAESLLIDAVFAVKAKGE